MNKEIQDTINNFFKENKGKKIKKVNNLCAKRKKKCIHLKGGKCIRGWCLV